MSKSVRMGMLLLFLLCLCHGGECAEPSFRWTPLPPLPDRLGVAGPYAGTHAGVLLVAGGANFPGKPPWEGGVKVWHDTVFVLEQTEGPWKPAGRLPRPLGYGVTLSTKDGVACLGGSDRDRHYASSFLLRWDAGQLLTEPLPDLPQPCANACGALLGRTIYLAGGTETPTATAPLKTFWALDLDATPRRWQTLEPWPGPARMLAVAAAHDEAIYIMSGTELTDDAEGKPVRRYLKDAYRYRPETGWQRIADLPRPAVAAPSPAFVLGDQALVVLGGDDGTKVGYQPLDQHPGFPRSRLVYNLRNDAWQTINDLPAAPVTTTVVPWQAGWVIPSGEIRPGVRTPAVWSLLSGRESAEQSAVGR